MAEIKPELFADGKCGTPLPAGELLQVFKFGQFCPLKVLDGSDEAPVVVGKARQAAGTSAGGITTRSLVPFSASAYSSSSEFTFKELLSGESSLKLPPEQTPVMLTLKEVAHTIATRQVKYKGRNWEVALTPDVIAELVSGRPTDVEIRDGNVRKLATLQPGESLVRQVASAPSVSEFEIFEYDLPSYLASPWLPGQDNLPFLDLKLNDENVQGLVRTGRTIVRVGAREIGIRVTKDSSEPNMLPGLLIAGGIDHTDGGGKTAGGPKVSGSGAPVGSPTSSGTSGVAPGVAGAAPSVATASGTHTIDSYQPRSPLKAADFKGITLAVYFEWRQEWTLKGFSRGRLLHSLSLTPQEETTIELSTWERRKRTLEQSSVTETEQSLEDEEKTQDATEIYRELAKKDEFQWKVGGELDAQYNGGTVNVKLKAQADAQDKTNAEDLTKNTTKSLREGIQKAAAKVKTQRSSKISETAEIGQEEKVTRKVRNPNLCHTLNLDYYEVITHYEISTLFVKDAMRFCAMIPNPVARETFPPEFVRQHEGALLDALLDRSLASGFDALRLLRARGRRVGA